MCLLLVPMLDSERGASRPPRSCSTGSGTHGPRRNTPAPAKFRRTETGSKGKKGRRGAAHLGEADGERRAVEVAGGERTVRGEAPGSAAFVDGESGAASLLVRFLVSRSKTLSGRLYWREGEGDGGRSHQGPELDSSVVMALARARKERAAAGAEETRVRVCSGPRDLKKGERREEERGSGGDMAGGELCSSSWKASSAPCVRTRTTMGVGQCGSAAGLRWAEQAQLGQGLIFFSLPLNLLIFVFIKQLREKT